MKYFIILLLLVNASWCQDDGGESTVKEGTKTKPSSKKQRVNSMGDKLPCPKLGIDCIKKYLNDRVESGCEEVSGKRSEDLDLEDDRSRVYIGFANATFGQEDVQIRNFGSGKVTAFFYNTAKGVTGITVTFTDIEFSVRKNFVRYLQPGSTPYTGKVGFMFNPGNISITTFVTGVDKFSFTDESTTSSTYLLSDPDVMKFNKRSKVANELTPVIDAIKADLKQFAIDYLGPRQSFFLAGNFIQKMLCKFEGDVDTINDNELY